jgi:hypothetical protein
LTDDVEVWLGFVDHRLPGLISSLIEIM